MRTKILSLLLTLTFLSPFLYAEREEYEWIRSFLLRYPDFPQAGVTFLSHSPLLREPEAFRKVIEIFSQHYSDYALDAIAGLDSRGFIFGSALSFEMGVPFVMIRKAGKLPGAVERVDYELEYGKSSFEIEVGSIKPGARVLIIDDVLATGGTAAAAAILIEKLNASPVELACLIEIEKLKGRDRLEIPVFSLLLE